MTKLEKLYQKAHDAEIDIYDRRISKGKKAICFYYDSDKTIAMDREAIASVFEETELLAEEIGHYETDALYMIEATANTPSARSNRLKCEARAKKWAVRHVLPVEDICKAAGKGCRMNYEMAEELGVTTDFLDYAINYYVSKNELVI